jgi:hypothetical protein
MRYLQDYQEFGRQCEKCREDLMLGGLPLAVKRSVDALQAIFTACLATIEQDEHHILESVLAARLQAFNVEINKQIKLLRMDCLFLQTAKQPTTIAQRHTQMLGRLDLLKAYAEGVLEL